MALADESEIQRIGREIFGALDPKGPSVFQKDFWNGKIMDWSMRDEAFKVEMFRFVDVFPVLRTPEHVARHLQEYFCRPDQDFPAWIQLGLRSVSAGSLVARTAASQIEKNIKGMAAGFVVGHDAADALPKLVEMRRRGIAFTVDLLGESTVSEREALEVQARYLKLLRELAQAAATWPENPQIDRGPLGPVPRVNVSIKISALHSQIDPIDFDGSRDGLVERLLPILREARRVGAFVNLDMEQYELKDLTIATFKALVEHDELRGWGDLGCVMQAYLRDSLADTRALVDWARAGQHAITVRLVKGAYWDYETVHAQQQGWPIPVYQQKPQSDANYEACAEALLSGWPHVRLAVGSHNVRTIAAVMAGADRLGVPKGGIEIQMLYGMAEPMKKAILGMGYRLRDYAPVGDLVPGMAYLVRRLLENTSNEGFLRARFVENVDPAKLLARPTFEADRPDPTPQSEFLNEPHTDFARASNRDAMRKALALVRARLGQYWPIDVGGRTWQTPRTLESTNPARDGEIVGRIAVAEPEIGEAAIKSAYEAFARWSQRPVAERASLVRRVGQRMSERRMELAAWMVLEVGKGWREADADVAEAIDFCRYYADEAERLQGSPRRLGRYPGERNELFYQPMGVGAIIGPWNFPLAILVGMAIGAVVTGNCVILKPAEQSSVIAGVFMEVLREVGLPPGVINYVPGLGEEIGAWLVAHPYTRFVAFTGSREVGLSILREANVVRAGQPGPKRVVCEMGGKNAIIVDDDADLDEAVAGVIHSAFGFQGQKCSACSRVIVVDTAYDAFVGRLVEAARSLELGDPADPRFANGPVIDAESAAKVRRYIERGRTEGRELLVTSCPEGSAWVPLAIFADIRPEHSLAQEEIFGPVLAVMKAANFDEALEIANGTNYALTGGVFSRSPTNLERARRELRVGNLYLNRGCTGALVYRQPFGGFKFSGLGSKAGGPDYLHQFVEQRSISENQMRRGFAPED